jgi:thiol-disulfide isomerase/thioredoxin
MNKRFVSQGFLLFILLSLLMVSTLHLYSQSRNVTITIHLRGVYESKISLMALSSTQQFKSIADVKEIKTGESANLVVLRESLPGEFVLRFDYKEKNESSSYPSEKSIFINQQDLEIWINPKYYNNYDSTRFQKGERENEAFELFSKENSNQKKKLGLLQQFLINYDDTQSMFYKQGIEEYEMRRQVYNQWIDSLVNVDKTLFVSCLYRFQYVPQIAWEGTETNRMMSMIHHYFDGIDFDNPVITKTSKLNEWMNNYVNISGQMVTNVVLRDSLFPAAAKIAIEKAKRGNPIIYGWMVDYFYRGFETNDIPKGMKMLQPYLSDTNCLTSKRMEIERRLKGMETLVKGSMAPDILLKDAYGGNFELNNYETSSKYILLLFWSAECGHCKEMIDFLYPWQSQPEILQKISVIAISMDDTETEVNAWDQKIKELAGWKHMRAIEGINSKVASDYFVLATPVMILLNARTKEIVSLPSTFSQLKTDLQ